MPTESTMAPDKTVQSLLPLPTVSLRILMAIAGDERHGYAIMRTVAGQGGPDLNAGTLYRALHRMHDRKLIDESRRRPSAAEDDERRRYYRLTPFGRAVLRAEIDRLNDLIRVARACGLTPARAR
jgi:DNA-binding PadR family transcriptional regulator